MTAHPRTRPSTRSEGGFTLVELLVVVATIGLIASIAIPELRNAMFKARRNAAVNNLKTLRHQLVQYAGDKGSYPSYLQLNYRTLQPLVPTYIRSAASVLKEFQGDRLLFYYPWNFFEEPFSMDIFTSPQSFVVEARLKFDKDIWFYMTDGVFWMYDEATWKWTKIEDAIK